jgi:hypothetical protein
MADAHLLPSPGALAKLVSALTVLGDEPFESLCLHRLDQIGKASLHLGRVPNRLGELRQDGLFQRLTPLSERFSGEIPSFE